MGRLIDADRLKAHYCWWAGGSKEMSIDEAKKTFDTIIDVQPTVDAVPLEDYRSMERTANKLTEALADAEPTEEQVKEYCRKRCLVIVTNELFNEIKARWSAEPVVRCKDCMYLEPSLNSDWSWCCYFDSKVRGDDFCSHGERREDETD